MVRVDAHTALDNAEQVGLQFGDDFVFLFSVPARNEVARTARRVEENIEVVYLFAQNSFGKPQRETAQVGVGKKYAVLFYILAITSSNRLK